MNRLRPLHHYLHSKRFYLSKLSSLRQNKLILNYSQHHYKYLKSIPSYNHQSLFSTTPKDDNKSDSDSTNIEATSSEPTPTTDETPPKPEEQQTESSSTDTTTTSSTVTKEGGGKFIPLIRIHDEEKPQLSIKLPNRWPFNRLARPPKEDPEPLNLHQMGGMSGMGGMNNMSTFSGVPAQQFMPTEAEKKQAEEFKAKQQKKTNEEKNREQRVKFWKRFTLIMFLTPLILYIMDNRKAKALAKTRGEYIASAYGNDSRLIRDMSNLNNAQLMDLYHWILKEECDNDPNASLTVDKFGELFVNAVNIFKQRSGPAKVEHKDIRLSREYDDALTARQRKNEKKWLTRKYERVQEKRLTSKTKEVQPWDLNVFFTEYKLSSSNEIPLTTLFTAISQITTDQFYNKAEIAFRIKGQHLTAEEPRLRYVDLVELIEDMVITGHFSTDSLIVRRSYFPSTWGLRNAEEICDIIYRTAGIEKGEDGQSWISFNEFGEAILTLSAGKKWYESMVGFFLPDTYKPWIQFWYVSDRSKLEIKEAENKEKRRLKKEEKKNKKQMNNLDKQDSDNLTTDSSDNDNDKSPHLQAQTN